MLSSFGLLAVRSADPVLTFCVHDCFHQGATQGLCDLVKPAIRAPHLPEFFWTHLEKDLELLAKATGKSLDEAAVLMHLVLKQILEVGPPRRMRDNNLITFEKLSLLVLSFPTESVVGTVSSLGATNARAEWEKIFNQDYLQPLLLVRCTSYYTLQCSIVIGYLACCAETRPFSGYCNAKYPERRQTRYGPTAEDTVSGMCH